jgi:hypothetical protein
MIPIVILSLGFLFLSLIAFIWGLVKWNNSSSEIKALGASISKGKGLRPTPEQSRIEANPSVIGAPAQAIDTIAAPVSVTEQTTHLLDEDVSGPTQNQRA